jgi:hypothetical protein
MKKLLIVNILRLFHGRLPWLVSRIRVARIPNLRGSYPESAWLVSRTCGARIPSPALTHFFPFLPLLRPAGCPAFFDYVPHLGGCWFALHGHKIADDGSLDPRSGFKNGKSGFDLPLKVAALLVGAPA